MKIGFKITIGLLALFVLSLATMRTTQIPLTFSKVFEPGTVSPGSVNVTSIPAGFSDVVIFATNRVRLKKDTEVFGDVVVNETGSELRVDKDAAVHGNLKADRISLDKGVVIDGDVFFNELKKKKGTITGEENSPLDLPVFPSPPPFQTADPRPGAPDVSVGSGQTTVLNAGDYGDITVAQNGTLIFSGGRYDVRSLTGGKTSTIGFGAATDLRVLERLDIDQKSRVGPAASSDIAASDIIIYVAGTDGPDDDDDQDCGECKGKVTELTLRYLGSTDAQIEVTQKNGDSVFNDFVPSGAAFSFEGTEKNGTLGKEIEVLVNAELNTKIHTSCSKAIGPGLLSGDFEVLAGRSKDGGPLCPVDEQDCGECKGKVTELTLRYQGTSGAQIEVKQKKGGSVFNDVVQPGGEFTFNGTDKNGTLGTEIEVLVNAELNTKIHTSCSKAIGPGLLSGDFEVLAGRSKDGGPLCPVDEPPGDDDDAARIGKESEVSANIYANGTLSLKQGTDVTGALLAVDIKVDKNSTIRLDSFFSNRPPVADPQDVSTDGASSLQIILTGSDPEGGDLSFSVDDTGLLGTLSNLTEIVPPMVGRCSVSGTSCEVDGDCPGETCVDLQQPSITSASVTYTPPGPDNVADSFTFTVEDPDMEVSAPALVQINPPGDPTDDPAPLSDVVADPQTLETETDVMVTILLTGAAPCEGECDGVGADVKLTFSIASGPTSGTLANLTQGTEVPQRSATVDFTPASGITGVASFDFQVAGDTNGDGDTLDAGETETATVIITVNDPTPPEPAPNTVTLDDQEVETDVNTPVEVTLTATTSTTGLTAPLRKTLSALSPAGVQTQAAALIGAAVAGNVADGGCPVPFTNSGDCTSPLDGEGDNRNNLPGGAPVFMSAGVDLSGGAGSNGIVRMQFEWDISGLDLGVLQNAQVILHTNKGSVDVLDTDFFAGAGDQDGLLGLASEVPTRIGDFEAPVVVEDFEAPVVLATMLVPDVSSGTNGTFEFNVLQQLIDALEADLTVFSIQGRVDESLAGQGSQRGLQVRTTATGNLNPGSVCPAGLDECEPMLSITTGTGVPLSLTTLTLRFLTVPEFGTINFMIDGLFQDPCAIAGRLPGCTPGGLSNNLVVSYIPNPGFVGADNFTLEAELTETITGSLIDNAIATYTFNVGTASASTQVTLEQNHPNPFNPSTTISFVVPEAGEATLAIYNMRGQLIQSLHSGPITAGNHSIVWDGKDTQGNLVPSGVYFYQLRAGDFRQVKKLTLLK